MQPPSALFWTKVLLCLCAFFALFIAVNLLAQRNDMIDETLQEIVTWFRNDNKKSNTSKPQDTTPPSSSPVTDIPEPAALKQNPITENNYNQRPKVYTRKLIKIELKAPVHYGESSLPCRSSHVLFMRDLPRVPQVVRLNVKSSPRTPEDRQKVEGAVARQLRRNLFLSRVLGRLRPLSQRPQVAQTPRCSCTRCRKINCRVRTPSRKQQRNKNKARRKASTASKNCLCKNRNYRLKKTTQKVKSFKRFSDSGLYRRNIKENYGRRSRPCQQFKTRHHCGDGRGKCWRCTREREHQRRPSSNRNVPAPNTIYLNHVVRDERCF